MVTVTIDGHEVQVAEGTNIVEAAGKAGIEVPTYCYHPGLSVVGQCRICFVEIEGQPRLVTACSTPVADGMSVLTGSERVKEARAAVMEFLLENHPLDCPVCDQAGECYLQDYSFEHGLDTTHMVDERRTFPGFERRLIGPHVVQNQNRCIQCTRCVRFTQEISETSDLTMKARGNHSYIDTFNSEPYDNPWSACAADVCPVGALTVKEFRFRARVWHLEETPSICPGCSIGCNISLGNLKGIVHRFVPRHNPEINGWWMCDYGRFLAEGLNDRDIEQPSRADAQSEERAEMSWAEAIDEVARLIATGSDVQAVVSANLPNEALLLAKKVLADHLGARVLTPINDGEKHKIKNAQRQWIGSVDSHANSTGARLIGLPTGDQDALVKFLESSNGPLIVLDNRAHPWLATDAAAAALKGRPLIVLARTHTPLSRHAAVVLPLASWAETEGTYTSSTGRVQLAQRAFFPKAGAKPAAEALLLLGARLEAGTDPNLTPRAMFEELAAEVPAFAGMTYRRLAGEPGVPALGFEEVAHVG
ncbi:MAG: (2Fe-2S)-binding protein [Acidobacteria bacterium]|jgi:NADH-quinone oxidoreductase subunit G|nr:(2Fe-2S)-binding protein [Acidobacteriota bacterium]